MIKNKIKVFISKIVKILKRDNSLKRELESLPNAPDLFFVYRQFNENPNLTRKPGGWNYRGKFYPDYLTVGGASFSILRVAKKYCRGKGVDVGAGLWPFPGAKAIDVWRGEGRGMSIHDISSNSLDYLFSSHCLEHVKKWKEELDTWISKIKEGGSIFLYLPHPECKIWNPGSPMVGDEHKWQPTPEKMKKEFKKRGIKRIKMDCGPDHMMSFYITGKK